MAVHLIYRHECGGSMQVTDRAICRNKVCDVVPAGEPGD